MIFYSATQFEKPPLAYWLIEYAFRTWGESPFTARFFPAVFATLGVIIALLFRAGRALRMSVRPSCQSDPVDMRVLCRHGENGFLDIFLLRFYPLGHDLFYAGLHAPPQAGDGVYRVFTSAVRWPPLTKSSFRFFIAQLAVVLFLLYQRQINFLRHWAVAVGLLLYLIIALPLVCGDLSPIRTCLYARIFL